LAVEGAAHVQVHQRSFFICQTHCVQKVSALRSLVTNQRCLPGGNQHLHTMHTVTFTVVQRSEALPGNQDAWTIPSKLSSDITAKLKRSSVALVGCCPLSKRVNRHESRRIQQQPWVPSWTLSITGPLSNKSSCIDDTSSKQCSSKTQNYRASPLFSSPLTTEACVHSNTENVPGGTQNRPA
jgi:hypothetical protein